MAGLVVFQKAGGTILPVACRVMCGIAGPVNRQMTPAVPHLAPDWMPCETTGQGLRETAPENALQTMYDTTLRTMGERTSSTGDQTTVQTTSRTVRGVIPRVGVSAWRYLVKAPSCNDL